VERARDPFARFLGALSAGADTAAWRAPLAVFAVDRLRLELHRLCGDAGRLEAVAEASYVHGNGFAKIVLARSGGRALRLHVATGSAEENIHDHRWSFASKVLFGAMTNVLFEDAAADAAGIVLSERRYVRAGEESLEFPVGEARVHEISRTTYVTGDAYHMVHSQLHRIVWDGRPTGTLMVTAAPARDHNRLLTNVEKPRLREVRLSVGEVGAQLCQILGHLDRQATAEGMR
jgi:hypothetical protein